MQLELNNLILNYLDKFKNEVINIINIHNNNRFERLETEINNIKNSKRIILKVIIIIESKYLYLKIA